MSYALEFTVQGLPKLANQLLRGHWRSKHGHTKLWKRKVWLACWHLAPPEPLQRARLTFTRVSSNRPDFDNLVSSFKATIDGLVEARILIDDKPENIERQDYFWERGKLKQGFIKVNVEAI